MSEPSTEEIGRIAAAVAADLCQREPRVVEGDAGLVAAVVAGVIRANFAEEAEIIRETHKAFEAMGSAAAGMDRGKLLAGIRERLAKQRGFAL